MHPGLHFARIPDVQHVGSTGTKLDMLHMAQLYAQAMHILSSSNVRALRCLCSCRSSCTTGADYRKGCLSAGHSKMHPTD